MEYHQNHYQANIKVSDEVVKIVDEHFSQYNDIRRRHIAMYVMNLIVNDGIIAVSRQNNYFRKRFRNSWHSYRIAIDTQDINQD